MRARCCRPAPGELAGGRRSLARPRFAQVPLLARLWRAVPTGGRRSKPSPRFFPMGTRFAALGGRGAGLKAPTGRTGRRSLRGRALRRSALSPRLVLGNREKAFATPDPHDRHALRLAAIDDPKGRPDQFTQRTLAELRDDASQIRQILEESDAVEHPPESPFAGRRGILFRVPEPQFFQVANGRLRKANETFRHGFTRCRVVSWPRQATGRVRPPDRQAPRRPLA